jgi:hypothetical protein
MEIKCNNNVLKQRFSKFFFLILLETVKQMTGPTSRKKKLG